MSVDAIQRDLSGLFNYPSDPNPTTQADYQDAVKNWVNGIINLVDSGLWQPTTDYAVGNIIRTPSIAPQYVLVCDTAGQSGNAEPDYSSVTEGSVITDNSVTWVVRAIAVEHDIPDVSGKANADASNVGVNAETDNSTAWGSAIGGGAIAEDDGKLVKGGTVYAVTSELASDIADNTNDIAQNTTDIDIAQKDIKNIKALLQGTLYDYQTDTDSAYTKSVPAGAMPYASLDKVGGKTVAWTQFADNSIDRSVEGRSTYDSTTQILTVNATGLGANYFPFYAYTGSWINGHKYLFTGINLTCNKTDVRVTVLGRNRTTGNALTNGFILEANNTGTGNMYLIQPGSSFEGTYDVSGTIRLNVHDLTALYGAGNEPTTYAEFQETYPALNYAYDDGSLLSAGVTGVVSRGKNLFNYLTCTNTGVVDDAGTVQTNTKRLFSDKIPVLPNTTYYFKTTATASAENITVNRIIEYDGNGNFMQRYSTGSTTLQTFTYTTRSGVCYIVIDLRTSSLNVDLSASMLQGNTQLEVGSAPTTFVPYMSATISIPAAVQALEGYGWSAGSASNYIDFERKKFVQCVGKIILNGTQSIKTVDWRPTENGVGWVYAYSLTNNKPTSTTSEVGNIVSDKWVAVNYGTVFNSGQGIALSNGTSNGICIWQTNTTLTDETAINTFLSSNPVTVYYELENPIETDISEYLTDDNMISVEGGGTLTFPNSNGDDYRIPVPSTETYMIDLQNA